MKNLSRFMLVAIIVMILASVGIVGAQDDSTVVVNVAYSDVVTIDPSLGTSSDAIQVLSNTFPGLAIINESTGVLEPGIASSWEVDEETKVYTFHLIEGISWVRFNAETGEVEQVMDDMGNPRYVTAHDVVYGWQRQLNPETASSYAYMPAEWIENGYAVNDGEMGVEELGIEALDDYTVAITATDVTAFIPMVYGTWLVTPQPQWTIEENGDAWTEVGNYHSYGPYVITEWVHDDHMNLVKNPFWAGTEYQPAASIENVVYTMLEESAAFDGFLAGDIDVTGAPLSEMDRIQSDPVLSEQLYIGPRDCSYYYGFNVTKEPVDNVHIRRALSYALDRQALIDNVLKGGQEPAQWFSRPLLLQAAPNMDTNPDTGIWFDPEAAQEELALGLADLGLSDASELPTITIMHNTSEGHASIAQAVQGFWKEHLGIDVQISNQEWAVYLETLQEDSPQVWRLGWCSDYPDAHNFLSDVFLSTSGNNNTNWGSEAYDALLEEAKSLTDQEARRELYAQAEEILVYEDAAIIPIYWYTSVSMSNPDLERTFSVYTNAKEYRWSLGSN